MQPIRHARELQPGGRKVCVAIGMFDGVHLGHQQVIRQAIHDARQHHGLSVAITFDRHPSSIIAPEKAPLLIYSLPQKLREIEALGVDAILLIEFNRAFSQTPGEQFVRELARDFGQIYSVCVGRTFSFGHKRSGNVPLLQTLGRELKFQVHGLAAVSLNEQVVSSTRIRERIASGDLDSATQMLGRSYSLSGEVVRGDRLGRQLGFPTANLNISGILTPPNGVYAVRAKTHRGTFAGAANIGVRPTVSALPEKRLEVHLLDFADSLYGSEVEIAFVDRIRGEQKFDSIEALQTQIALDISAARVLLQF